MSDRMSIGDVEDRKLKRRMEEPPAMDEDLEQLLTLRLGSNSSKSLKISEDSGSGVGSGEGDSSPPEPIQPLTPSDHHEQEVQAVERQYSCKYCNKKFSSTQALGGHQNAHRRERVLSKKLENEFELGGKYRYGRSNSNVYPYSISMGNNALQLGGSSLYHGSQFNSIGHVSSPSMTWTNGSAGNSGGYRYGYSYNYGNHGMQNTSLTAPQPQFGVTNNYWGGGGFAIPNRSNRLNMSLYEELNQVPSLAESASNGLHSVRALLLRGDVGHDYGVLEGGHGHGGLVGNPNVISFNNASSEEIDLELKL